MVWKLLIFLPFTQGVLSFNRILWGEEENIYPYLTDTDTYENVGEPLILTPYIEENKLKEAREAARVNDENLLPGIESYSGYFTVNKKYNGNLWFWYFPVANRPVDETPLIVWLHPTQMIYSAVFGIFCEIGPFTAVDNSTLKANEFSWGKDQSLLFIDPTVGTGFSFTNDGGYATNETTIGEQLYSALQQFLTVFPELRKAPLFVAGEADAGKHVTSLGIQIHRRQNSNQPINFQGLAMGNGYTDPVTLANRSDFLREVGLIDDNAVEFIKVLEDDVRTYLKNGEMEEATMAMWKATLLMLDKIQMRNPFNYALPDNGFQCFVNTRIFLKKPEVRRALNVGNTKLIFSNDVRINLARDHMGSVTPWLEELLDHYKVLLYSGHLDPIVPYPLTVKTCKSLKYSGANQYAEAKRLPFYYKGDSGGYYKVGGKLTEVMVRGAGLLVPRDRPGVARGLIRAFVRNTILLGDTAIFDD